MGIIGNEAVYVYDYSNVKKLIVIKLFENSIIQTIYSFMFKFLNVPKWFYDTFLFLIKLKCLEFVHCIQTFIKIVTE